MECMGVLCTWVKLLTDLQVMGCELQKMLLAAGLRLDSLWGGSDSAAPDPLAVIRGREGEGTWARLGYLFRDPRVPSYAIDDSDKERQVPKWRS